MIIQMSCCYLRLYSVVVSLLRVWEAQEALLYFTLLVVQTKSFIQSSAGRQCSYPVYREMYCSHVCRKTPPS